MNEMSFEHYDILYMIVHAVHTLSQQVPPNFVCFYQLQLIAQ